MDIRAYELFVFQRSTMKADMSSGVDNMPAELQNNGGPDETIEAIISHQLPVIGGKPQTYCCSSNHKITSQYNTGRPVCHVTS